MEVPFIMKLFSNTITTLEKALDYSSLNQKVIAQNIANVDTPNYKSKSVSFKAALQSAIDDQTFKAKRTDPRHFDFSFSPSSQSVITTTQNTSYNNNGNNVDLDKEMTDLATNQIYYNAVADRLSSKFKSLETVIKGGN